MPTDPDAVLIAIFCLLDDFCNQLPAAPAEPGAKKKVVDCELLSLALFQSLLGLESERSFLRFMARFLPGRLPLLDQSQYNRRLKAAMPLLERFRRKVLCKLDICTDLFLVDSAPVPVLDLVRLGRSGLFPELAVGHCASLKKTYFGAKLHLAVTRWGIPVLFELTPANADDRDLLEELFRSVEGVTVVGDKGYLDAALQKKLKEERGISTVIPHRKNQVSQLSEPEKQLYQKTRKRVESVFSQLASHFHLKATLSRTLPGLAARILQKLVAFTLGILLNRQFGRPQLSVATLLG